MQPFAPGQVWTYATRPHEAASRVIVCRVDDDPQLGEVVHIHVGGLRLANVHAPRGFVDHIGHLPFASAALRASVDELESSDAWVPEYEHGYREWRSARERGAGVWTIALAEVIAAMESAMR